MWINPEILQNPLPLNRIICLIVALILPLIASCELPVVTGAQRMGEYLPLLQGKRVGVLTNHTGLVDGVHLVDTLLAAGIHVKAVFAPEHGFRGNADAGEKVEGFRDPKTNLPVISLYGANRKPRTEDISAVDVMVFDLQDVGLRYYTYLSTLHYLMECCAETGTPLIVLDRPNPNGFYVDGPRLDPKYRSFVGMHPIPVVHGMTLGELAGMINGEGWLAGGIKCPLTVIRCEHYTHQTRYVLPVRPSPNLPDMRAVYLYPSLCYFEGTPVSVGRGTDFPFQVFGHPAWKGCSFSFTPRSVPGAKNPPLKDRVCFGVDLRSTPSSEAIIRDGINLKYVIEAYRRTPDKSRFFGPMFEKLIGVSYVRSMIEAGKSAEEIKAMWTEDVARFKEQRKPYLLYDE